MEELNKLKKRLKFLDNLENASYSYETTTVLKRRNIVSKREK